MNTREQLNLTQVCVSLQGKRIVEDFNLTVNRGDIGCLVGPSGCGKTTLLRTIAGFEHPDSGTIELNGQVIADAEHSTSPESRNVGMVFQDLALFPHLNVRKNIAFGMREKQKKEKDERVD